MAVPEHKKDACKYSTELAKQFLTLTTGGLAFLVASYFAGNLTVTLATLYACFGFFGLSAILGFLFLMSVIGNIDQNQSYDVYTARHRSLVATQIGAFAVGVVLLTLATLKSATQSLSEVGARGATLTVGVSGALVKHVLVPGRIVNTAIDSTGRILITVQPPTTRTPSP